MRDFVVMTDSDTEIPFWFAEKHDVPVFLMPYTIDGEEKLFDLGKNTDFEDFYTRVKNGAQVSTSTRSPLDIKEFFEDILKQNKDILYLCFSSALSGHYELAQMAKKEALEDFPDAKIEIIDTLGISMGAGLLVYHAIKKKEAGESMENIRLWVEENKLRALHLFSVDDLMYLKRTGRLSAVTAAVGTLLNLKPILKCDKEGKIVVFDKVKGRKNILKYYMNIIEQNYDENDDITTEVMSIVHANNLEAAEALKAMIEEQYHFKNIILQDVGPVIGAHTGPGVVAFLMMGKAENR